MGTLGEPAPTGGDLARPAGAAHPSIAPPTRPRRSVKALRTGEAPSRAAAGAEVAPARATRARLGLAVALAALGAWGGWLIARSSLLVAGRRVFCLFDDAMISMTYARNLIDGHGLNWARQGAPVEGFTHPLWLLLMLPANLPGIDLALRSLVVQVLSLALLALAAAAAWRLVRMHFAPLEAPFALPAAVLTAFYYPLAYWSVMGMETALQALLILVCVHLALDAAFAGRDDHLALWLSCTAAYLLRMDMLLLVVVVQVYLVAMGGLRPAGRRSWWIGLACFLAAVLGYELFRWVYFHDLLPNTYYLKLTGYPLGLRIRRGAMVLIDTIRISKGLLVLLPFAGLVLARGEARRRLLVLVAPFVVLCAYSVWVGGDAWEGAIACNRYLSFGVPLLFVPAAWSIAVVASRLGGGTWLRPAAAVAMALAVILTVAPYRPTLMLVAPEYRGLNAENTALGVAAARLVRPGGSVVGVGVGAIGYHADRPIVDLLGKNDRHIARLPARVPVDPSRFVPGHMKWDYPYSIGELHPDVLAQLWWNPGEAESLLQADYVPVRLLVGGKALEMAARRSSPHVVWSEADTKAGGPQ